MATDASPHRIGLRWRVTIVAVTAVGITLVVGAAALIGLVRTRLDSIATTAATLRARDIVALVKAGSLPRTLALPGEETAFVQVVDDRGAVIASTANVEGEAPVTSRRPTATDGLTSTLRISALDDRSMRVVTLSTDTPLGTVTVYAGESLAGADRTRSAMVAALALGLPLLLIVVGAVTWWAAGRTLTPVRRITRTMAEITGSDLHRRVPVPATADDIGDLAATVNDTLSRLESAVDRQRRFVADASHELRGPLAALRAELEISLAHPEATGWNEVARNALDDVTRLQHLTQDLLLLARMDSPVRGTRNVVDLGEVTEHALGDVDAGVIDVRLARAGSAPVRGDPDMLRCMVRNLIQNAVEHAVRGVDITVSPTKAGVQLKVADDGQGIPSERRGDIFERFVRLDSARTRDIGGSGLGLAIVADVVAGHLGTITVADAEPSGALFTVELPNGNDG